MNIIGWIVIVVLLVYGAEQLSDYRTYKKRINLVAKQRQQKALRNENFRKMAEWSKMHPPKKSIEDWEKEV